MYTAGNSQRVLDCTSEIEDISHSDGVFRNLLNRNTDQLISLVYRNFHLPRLKHGLPMLENYHEFFLKKDCSQT